MPADIPCEHCGANCGKHPVVWEEKDFCCHGCKQVYQLLNEHNLTQYYGIDENPGIKIELPSHSTKYAFLDKDEIKDKIYEFYEEGIAKVTFYIPSIHCASCIWLLEHLNKLHVGVKQASVNFVRKEYSVSFATAEITLRELVELLVSIHYVPDISLQTLNKKDITSVDKSLIYKIGVAGFIFGNVMLFSLPEYFNGESLGSSLGVFFNYISFVMSVPLVFYSGSDYIISAYKNIRKGIINIDLPIALGLITLFIVTSFEVLTGRGPGYSDSMSGFLFFLLIGRWYQSKTYLSLAFDRDYKSYFPVAVTKVEKGEESSVLLEEIEIGDKLIIRAKELIPADSVLVSGQALIDYSFVTGESTPVKKEIGEPLYAGGIQSSGSIEVKVSKEVKQSHLTQLWNQSEQKGASKNTMVSIIDNISIYFTVIVILIATFGLVYWIFTGTFQQAVLVFTSVLIVACPCALALSLPFSTGNAMRILGSKGFYLKNTSIVERLTKVDTIVFDKTGTITKPDENNVEFIGKDLSNDEITAAVSLSRQSVHPLSNALSKANKEIDPVPVEGFVEVSGRGIYGTVEGKAIKLGTKEYVTGKNAHYENKGTTVHFAVNEKYKGYFIISNKYRTGFGKLIEGLRKKYALFVLSGDNDTEKERLSKFINPDNLFFSQQPMDKMDFIDRLHLQNKTVLMTGDGLNDAGAFMKSDVALSVADDIYHFSPAGDAIIESSKFGKLYSYIKYAKKTMQVVRISFLISFLYNGIGLGFAITGNLSPVVAAILMPVSSVTIVLFATLTTKMMARKL